MPVPLQPVTADGQAERVGIGGSDLGPVMAYEALRYYSQRNMTYRFVSNLNSTDFSEVVRDPRPEATLFIVCSETFTTLEMLTYPRAAGTWSLEALGDEKGGIDLDNMIGFWDWFGGHYSMESAVGLSTMLAVGPEHFGEMVTGFNNMDTHFGSAPLDLNLPVLLGMMAIWNNNFIGPLPCSTPEALVPHRTFEGNRYTTARPTRGSDAIDRSAHDDRA